MVRPARSFMGAVSMQLSMMAVLLFVLMAGACTPSTVTIIQGEAVAVMASRPAKPPADLRVMTYNLRLPSAEDIKNNRGWNQRKSLLVKLIRDQRPDILGVQELWSGKETSPAAWFRSALTDSSASVRYLVVQGVSDHPEDIYLRADRFWVLFPAVNSDDPEGGRYGGCPQTPEVTDCPARLTSGFFLPPDPRSPCDSSLTGTAMEGLGRSAVFAIVRDRVTGRDFAVYNTHLHHRHAAAVDDAVRLEEVRCIREGMALLAGDLPVIVMGDLNAKRETPELTALQRGFSDDDRPLAFTHPADLEEGTFNGFCDDCVPRSRIDHILVSGFEVLDPSRAVCTRIGGRWPSDHCPVVLRLRLPDAEER